MIALHVEPQTMSVIEAAAVLGVSDRTLYKAIDRGEVRAIRIGRRIVIPRHVVDGMLAVGAENAKDLAEAADGCSAH